MTPLIDVVFQLLIFFMCASTGHLREFLLPADFGAGALEASQDVPPHPLGRVWIRLEREAGETVVDIEGRVYRDWLQARTVLERLGETAAEIPVILDIDGRVPMQDVIRLDDLCRAANFQSVSFAADPSNLRKP